MLTNLLKALRHFERSTTAFQKHGLIYSRGHESPRSPLWKRQTSHIFQRKVRLVKFVILHRVHPRYMFILRMTCVLERIVSPGKWNNTVELSEVCKAAAAILHPPECNFIFYQKTPLSVFNPLKAESRLYTVWTIYLYFQEHVIHFRYKIHYVNSI